MMRAQRLSLPAGNSQEGIDTVDEVGGTALRLLHQLSASLSAAEAICRLITSFVQQIYFLNTPRLHLATNVS